MVQLNFRTRKNGIPILSKNEIEEIAEIVIEDYHADLLVEPRSLDIDHFCESYAELEMDYQDLTNDQSILGMLVFNDCCVSVFDAENNSAKRITVYEGTVLIDNSLLKDDQLRRGRFTLSHEVSHWFLHKQIYLIDKNQISLFDLMSDQDKQPVIKCRSVDIESSGKKELITDDEWIEWQADFMASTLLMPKKSFSKEVRKKFKATGIKNAYYEIGTDINLDLWAEKLARELSDIFNVSVAAARIRLKNLGFVKYDLECKQYSLMLDS